MKWLKNQEQTIKKSKIPYIRKKNQKKKNAKEKKGRRKKKKRKNR